MNPTDASQLDWRLVTVIVVIDAILRGIALWKSARSGKKLWFLALFVINSAGILPALYLFMNRQKKTQPTIVPEIVTPQITAVASKTSKKKSTKKV